MFSTKWKKFYSLHTIYLKFLNLWSLIHNYFLNALICANLCLEKMGKVQWGGTKMSKSSVSTHNFFQMKMLSHICKKYTFIDQNITILKLLQPNPINNALLSERNQHGKFRLNCYITIRFTTLNLFSPTYFFFSQLN